MRSPEMGGTPPPPKEAKPRYIVGAKKNPDGTMDYSGAMTWNGPKNSESQKTPEFQQDIKAIITYLDELDSLLDQKTFKPGWKPLDTHLNRNITGITAFVRVLDQVSPEEFRVLVQKVRSVETKIRQALDVCKAEKIKREIGINKNRDGLQGEYVPDSTFMWLEKEGPAVLQSLKDLESRVK